MISKVKKRILFHLQSPPIPIDGGAARRVLGFLNYFKDRKNFFTVDAVSNNFWGNNRWTLDKVNSVKDFVENIYIYRGESNPFDFLNSKSQSFYHQKVLRQQLPVDSTFYTPPGYIRFFGKIVNLNTYDFVFINYLNYAHLTLDSKKTEIKTAIDIHDVSCENRISAQKNISYLRNLKFDYAANFQREIRALNNFDLIIVNSQSEIELLKSHLPLSKLRLIPHNIIEFEDRTSKIISYQERKYKYDLIFVGTGGHAPNIEGLNHFLEKTFPKIIQDKSDITLAIAGTVNQFIEINDVFKPNIYCLGYVENLLEVYLQSKVVICPLLNGAGTKVKLQEAMAYAIPVVTTSTGASGMQLVDGVNCFIADTPDYFANRVLQLLREPALAQKLSEEVACTFESQYSESVVYSKLDQIFGIVTT